jgi:hypothetical protein
MIKLSVWLRKEGANKHITDVHGMLPQPVLPKRTVNNTITHLALRLFGYNEQTFVCVDRAVLTFCSRMFWPLVPLPPISSPITSLFYEPPFCITIPRLSSLLAYSCIRTNMRVHEFGRCRVQVSDMGPIPDAHHWKTRPF